MSAHDSVDRHLNRIEMKDIDTLSAREALEETGLLRNAIYIAGYTDGSILIHAEVSNWMAETDDIVIRDTEFQVNLVSPYPSDGYISVGLAPVGSDD